MQIPESVKAVVQQACEQHPEDISAAVDTAEQLVHALPEYKSIVRGLIRNCIQELVYDARHVANVATKRNGGYYGGPGKVMVGKSESVQQVYQSVYAYYIAGTTLGELLGKDIPSVREHERSIANGHLFNVRLLEWLESQGVRGDKKVREVVPEKKLRIHFDRLYKEVQRDDAA